MQIKPLIICSFLLFPMIPSFSPTNSMSGYQIQDSPTQSNSRTTFAFLTSDDLTLGEKNYSDLESSITGKGFSYTTLESLSPYKKLDGIDVLIVLGLETIHEKNISLVKKFVTEGGSLLFAPSYKNPLGTENLTEVFGLNSTTELVRDNVTDEKRICLNNTWNKTSYLYTDVSNITVVNGTMLQEAEEEQKMINLTIRKHATLWGNNTTVVGKEEKHANKTGKNISLVYEIETWTGGRVVMLSSFLMLANKFFPQNEQFATNVIDWLAKKKNRILITLQEVNPSRVKLSSDRTINVKFQATKVNRSSLNSTGLNLTVLVERLSKVIASSSANTSQPTPQSTFSTQVTIPSDTKRGIAYIWVLGYKPFYGFCWSSKYEITLYKRWVPKAQINWIVLIAGFAAPLTASIFLIFKSSSFYKKKKKTIQELEEKAESVR